MKEGEGKMRLRKKEGEKIKRKGGGDKVGGGT